MWARHDYEHYKIPINFRGEIERPYGHSRENNIYALYWPGSSPNLNPIEQVWKILKQKLSKIIVLT